MAQRRGFGMTIAEEFYLQLDSAQRVIAVPIILT